MENGEIGVWSSELFWISHIGITCTVYDVRHLGVISSEDGPKEMKLFLVLASWLMRVASITPHFGELHKE